MSYTQQHTIWCDSCSEWDQATGSLASVRGELKRGGWLRVRGAAGDLKDLCPKCAKTKIPQKEQA